MDLQKFRDEFVLPRQGVIFLNHAGTSPLPRRSADAMKRAIDHNRQLLESDWSEIKTRMHAARQALAQLLHVPPNEIAFTRNTTEGINWIANGLPWKTGDRIVTIHGEYPANVYPWMRLQKQGVDLHFIHPVENRVTLEQIAEALTPNTRLLALSFVEFASGFRFDLEAVGALCRSREVLFLVDVIQGAGALPLDLKKAQVTFASGGAQKWLLGPQGAGYFYCSPENLSLLETSCVGSDSMKQVLPYLLYDYVLRDDARRFEYATPAMLPILGMGASLELLLEAGLDAVQQQIRRLTDILVEGALRKGYRCESPRGESEWSGIVVVSHPKESHHSVLNRLRTNNILAVIREGALRFSPHFYQTEAEMQRVIEVL